MAKVNMDGWRPGAKAVMVPAVVNDPDDVYIDGIWQEQVEIEKITALVGKRKVIQRKLDATRKRLKRLVSKLNGIEASWNPA